MPTIRKIDPTTYSGNPYVQSLISERVWSPGDVITYYLKPTDLDGNGRNDLTEKGADVAISGAYSAWAAVANIGVQKVTNPADAVWIEQAVSGSGGATHTLPYLRDRATTESGGNYRLLDVDPAQFTKGGQWYGIVLHEIGHGLGLEHTHESGLFPGVPAGDDDAPGDNGLNSKLTSIMSYNGLTSFTYGTPVTPMAFDIAAVQALYGANMTTATGNDSYVLPTANAPGTWYSCIWDAGGVDTVSVGKGAQGGATIDLRAATLRNEVGGGGFLSSVRGIDGGYTIANGVVIENAIGSVFSDTITGNAANNRLTGNGGVDTIYGFSGNDTLIAGAGAVRALVKPASQVNATQASAASLDGVFNLTADASIANATTIPHATVRATASGQAEWYKFTVAKAGQIAIDIDGASFDTEIFLTDAGGRQLATNDDSRPIDAGSVANPNDPAETRDSAITYNVTAPGTYYVRVERYGSDGTTTDGDYSMHVSVPGAKTGSSALQGSTLDGGDGADTLNGGNGSDKLDGGTGADLMSGGGGNDTYYVDIATDKVTEAAGGGADTVRTSVSYTLGAGQSVETLATVSTSSATAINLTGNELSQTILGNNGANVISAGDGADKIFGYGGKDDLRGGTGADQFVFNAVGDSTVSATDVIRDFSHTQGDKISLVPIDANTTVAGNQAFNFIGVSAFGHHAGELRATTAGAYTTISGDVNGDATADFSILVNATTFAAGDFLL